MRSEERGARSEERVISAPDPLLLVAAACLMPKSFGWRNLKRTGACRLATALSHATLHTWSALQAFPLLHLPFAPSTLTAMDGSRAAT